MNIPLKTANSCGFLKSEYAIGGLLCLAIYLLISLPTFAGTNQAIAICIGMPYVDPKYYRDDLECNTCGNDAIAMRDIARSAGFFTNAILVVPYSEATRSNISEKIVIAARNIATNGLFMLTFSGHGKQLADQKVGSPGHDEEDGFDESWCLYDGYLRDDELGKLWTNFHPGVRILLFSDSCYSGTIPSRNEEAALEVPIEFRASREKGASSSMERLPSLQNYSAASDSERAKKGNGSLSFFTEAVKSVWNGGNFTDYENFFYEIKRIAPTAQHGWLNDVTNRVFMEQRPFTITNSPTAGAKNLQ